MAELHPLRSNPVNPIDSKCLDCIIRHTEYQIIEAKNVFDSEILALTRRVVAVTELLYNGSDVNVQMVLVTLKRAIQDLKDLRDHRVEKFQKERKEALQHLASLTYMRIGDIED